MITEVNLLTIAAAIGLGLWFDTFAAVSSPIDVLLKPLPLFIFSLAYTIGRTA